MITRRRFLTTTAAGAVAAVAWPGSPALAAQTAEPGRPIDPDSLELFVSKYPDGQTLVEPGGLVDFSQIRIDARVRPTADWPNRLDPSEHWRADIVYSGPDPDDAVTRRLVRYWWGHWKHQNKAAGRSAFMEFAQFNHRAATGQNGTHRVEVSLRGDVSGLVAARSLEYTVAI